MRIIDKLNLGVIEILKKMDLYDSESEIPYRSIIKMELLQAVIVVGLMILVCTIH